MPMIRVIFVTMPLIAADVAIAGTAPTPEALRLAAEYSDKSGGRGMLVMVGGKITFERYEAPHAGDTPNWLASAAKSFWGPTIAAMIEDGLVSSFDEPAADTLAEWKGDPRKSKITLRHLLSLTSGIKGDTENLQGPVGAAEDKYKHAIGLPAIAEPGSRFRYGPVDFYVLGEIMERKLAPRGQTPLDYLRKQLLDPIGIATPDWVLDPSGNPHTPNGAFISAHDWAKYGQFLLDGGMWRGKRLLRADLLGECLRGGAANPGFGLTFWLNRPGGRGPTGQSSARAGDPGGFLYPWGEPEIFAALGAGPNQLIMVPSRDMVVIRQTDWPVFERPRPTRENLARSFREGDRGFRTRDFLRILLTGEAREPAPRRGAVD